MGTNNIWTMGSNDHRCFLRLINRPLTVRSGTVTTLEIVSEHIGTIYFCNTMCMAYKTTPADKLKMATDSKWIQASSSLLPIDISRRTL